MKISPPSRRIGILLSGRGSNFGAIADNVAAGLLDAEIGVVLSNKADAGGLAEARRRGLETVLLPSRGVERAGYDESLRRELERHGISLVCLAGFMRVLGPAFLGSFPHAVLNIHPSLLPSFPGLDAQRQALEHGVRFTGCTVHFVDESLDDGPIVKQAVVPVLAGDTVDLLSDRILAEEHRIYSESIALVLDGRCEILGRQVIIHEI